MALEINKLDESIDHNKKILTELEKQVTQEKTKTQELEVETNKLHVAVHHKQVASSDENLKRDLIEQLSASDMQVKNLTSKCESLAAMLHQIHRITTQF
jgi:hypothetical protein